MSIKLAANGGRSQASTVPVCIGRSSDGRTNRWRIICPACGAQFVPVTTMFAVQGLECSKPRCQARMTAYYNEDRVELDLVP